MNEKIRITILKILSYISLLLGFYPIFKIIKVSLLGKSPVFSEVLFYIVITVFIHFSVRLIMRKINDEWNLLLAHFVLILPAAVTAICYYRQGMAVMLFETFVSAIFGFIIVRAYFKEYYKSVESIKVYIAVFVMIPAFTVSTFFEPCMYLKKSFFIIAYIYLFLVLIIRNQSNIDNVFNKRFDKSSGLPVKIREYNTYNVMAIFAFLLLFFNAKNVVVFIFKLIGLALTYVISLILVITSFFMFREGTGEFEMNTQVSDILANSQDSIIIDIIIAALAALAAYKLIPAIAALLSNLFKLLIKYIFHVQEEKAPELEYYTDTVEIVVPSRNKGKEERGRRKISIKSALKLAEQIKNPQEKMKYLYGIILKSMSLKGITVEKFDTTGEICKKTDATGEFGHQFRKITIIYDKVKYGEQLPAQEDISDTVEMVRKLSKGEI
ncbi:MAG: hypothetical protein GX660_15715 [Clostridiaceae bacterium]|nr:hypothetical protein [Clostridiaceae bacterium]